MRILAKCLRRGEPVGVLPDQVPQEGEGVWAPFFGRPAYTMTLAARLALQTGARVVLIWGERLPWGRGFRLHTQTLGHELSPDLEVAVVQINQAMERLVRQKGRIVQTQWRNFSFKVLVTPAGLLDLAAADTVALTHNLPVESKMGG